MTILSVAEITAPVPVDFPQIGFLGLLESAAGGFDAAYREFTPARSNTETAVRCQRYDDDFKPVGVSRLLKAKGEDPRIFIFAGRATVLTHVWQPEKKDWQQLLIDLESGDERIIRHDLRFAGKNWMPVVGTEPHLLLIRSLDPLCVLRLNADCRAEQVISEPQRDIGEYRGGAAAVKTDDPVMGIGHQTQTDPLRHTPFRFVLDLRRKSVTFFETRPIGFDGQPVIDPTSRLMDGRVVCSCSRDSWWNEQKINHRLCQITE